MQTKMRFAVAAALFCLSASSLAAPPAIYTNAVAQNGRPAEAVALDAGRKPAEVLEFLGLKSGMTAADVITGSGYWAEIMARVVGPKGQVTAFEPDQFYTDPEEQKVWALLQQRRPDIRFVRYPFDAFAAAPGSFDFLIINLNYHDLYWESEKYHIPRSDPSAFVRALYAAAKPGGVVGVIDHVGPAGDTRAIVNKMHRIDPATVKADFEAAGFRLEAESPILRNPDDDHTKGVFDPAVRGKTDCFIYRFRKPC